MFIAWLSHYRHNVQLSAAPSPMTQAAVSVNPEAIIENLDNIALNRLFLLKSLLSSYMQAGYYQDLTGAS